MKNPRRSPDCAAMIRVGVAVARNTSIVTCKVIERGRAEKRIFAEISFGW